MATKCGKAEDAAFKNEYETQCVQETGFAFFQPMVTLTADQLTRICSSAACKKTIEAVKAAEPTECKIWGETLLYKDILNTIDGACSGTAVAPAPGGSKPTNDSSTPVATAPPSSQTSIKATASSGNNTPAVMWSRRRRRRDCAHCVLRYSLAATKIVDQRRQQRSSIHRHEDLKQPWSAHCR